MYQAKSIQAINEIHSMHYEEACSSNQEVYMGPQKLNQISANSNVVQKNTKETGN